jgi:hypothetical protein
MSKYRITIPFVTVQGGKVVKQEEMYYDGPRFLYRDYPDYTATLEKHGEWSILASLCDIILYHRNFPIVELGAGDSTTILARAAETAGVKFYSVDLKPWKGRQYKGNFEFFNGSIEDFMKGFVDTPAIVLIDANHKYEIARKEFEFFFDKLVDGGVIFLHDTYPPCEKMCSDISCSDVYKLRQDIERTDKDILDVFTWPYTAKWCGLTMVIKKERNRPIWGI